MVGVIVIVAIGVLVMSMRPDPTIPAGGPAVATAEEFEAALASALDALGQQPGVTGVEESRIGDHLASKVWWSARPGGDSVVVQQRDIDVADTAWWPTSDAPLRVGERVAVTVWVTADGTMLEAIESPVESQVWTERGAPPGPMALGLGLLYPADPGMRDFMVPDADLIRRWVEEDGTTTWELTGRAEGGRWMQRFHVDPRGLLAAWETQRLSPVEGPTADAAPIDASRVTYLPLGDPEPIPVPKPGTALDLGIFDLPDGFMLTGYA